MYNFNSAAPGLIIELPGTMMQARSITNVESLSASGRTLLECVDWPGDWPQGFQRPSAVAQWWHVPGLELLVAGGKSTSEPGTI